MLILFLAYALIPLYSLLLLFSVHLLVFFRPIFAQVRWMGFEKKDKKFRGIYYRRKRGNRWRTFFVFPFSVSQIPLTKGYWCSMYVFPYWSVQSSPSGWMDRPYSHLFSFLSMAGIAVEKNGAAAILYNSGMAGWIYIRMMDEWS